MSKEKKAPSFMGGAIALFVFAGLFLIGFIIALAFFLTGGSETASVLSVIFGIALALFLILGFVMIAKGKATKKLLADPNSIAYRTYGGNGDYLRFRAYIDRAAQRGRNAATNALGALSCLCCGVGVVSWGTSTSDVFINEKELLIKNPSNGSMNDNGFVRLLPEHIANTAFQSSANSFTVMLLTASGRKMTLEVPTTSADERAKIQAAFEKFGAAQEQTAAQEPAPAAQTPFAEYEDKQ